MFVNGSGQYEQFLERTFHRCFLPSFTCFGWGVSEENIKMWKVNGRQMPSDGKSSLYLWQGELIIAFDEVNTCFYWLVYSHCLELGWLEFAVKSRTSLCINIYNLTPVESKFRLSRIKVLVLRCRKPYYLHSLSRIYLSKHVYYLGIKIGSQVKHPVIDFDIFTLGYFTCLFHNLSN